LFALALARPYFSSGSAVAGGSGPVHAVLILDNSLSMGYERFDGTLLDEARRKAEEFIDQLPQGSRISVVPLCGSETAFSLDPYRTQEDAREALGRIKVVDRAGSGPQAIDLALEACRQAPDLPAKRVAFIGDQQVGGWPAGSIATQLEKLPELQVVNVSGESAENAWIADFHVQDGIADIETPTTFYATIRYEGTAPRSNVQVTLEVDGAPVASRTIDLEPGQSRELQFPYRFDIPTEPGRPSFVVASIAIQDESIEGDRLRADNTRHLAVPVVAALPVVFIDQYGEAENPQRNEYGETFRLRRLLAPVTSRSDYNRQLVQIRHTTIDRMNRELLEDARLVVIAGVPSPESAVPLLRDYVKQGGQLLIAAGAKFDPKAWSELAWLDGAGILPAPLKPEPVGQVPEETVGQLDPFQLDFATLVHRYFLLEETSREELADLYQQPFFFKAVAVDAGDDVLASLLETETKRIAAEREFLAASDARRKTWAEKEARGTLSEIERQEREEDNAKRAAIEPNWLLWSGDREHQWRDESPAETARRRQPQVIGRFTREGLPFIAERPIGHGRVVFVASGVYSSWNDLTKTNATLLFDRILRSLLEETLPRRNLESVEQLTLPVESGDRRVRYTLTRPSGLKETLAIDALGSDRYGVTIRNITQCGKYVVTAERATEDADSAVETRLWEIPLVVNGPERESQLQTLDAAGLRERLGEANYRWVERDEPISLAGAQIRGQDLWKWLMLLVLVGLLAELVILAWPVMAKERAHE